MNDQDLQQLTQKIEAILFTFGRPTSRVELIKRLAKSAEEIEEGITALKLRLTGGIMLVDDGHNVELRTAPGASELIEQMQRDENSRDIGKAGLEALAAILYRGPLTRAEIDFIRGVNSSQTLRTLTMRGLIRKVENPKERALPDGRRGSFLYEPTTELLAHLGLSTQSHLPEYEATRDKLQQLEDAYRAKEGEQS
jgi:segregation and condensation protein B